MSDALGNLPAGWARLPLGALGEWVGGGTPSKENASFWTGGSIPWVSPKDMKVPRIRDAEDHITEEAVKASATKVIPAGSVLVVTRSGILSRTLPVAVNEVPVTVNQDLKCLTPEPAVLSDYVAYGLQAFEGQILKSCSKHGTTVASIEFGSLKGFSIPVAPLAQQRQIVEALDSYFSRLDEVEAGLERVQRNLKRYRASVLQAAVTGRLVPTEAELARAEGREYEPASELLKRILVERRRRWEESGRRGKYQEPNPPDTSKLPELPEGWCWASVEAIASESPSSISAGPFGTIFKARDFRPSGVPIIFLRHVKPGRYLTLKPTFMDQGKWEELFRDYSVYGGELLVTKLGDPPGDCAVFTAPQGPAMLTPDVMKLSVDHALVATSYVMNYLNSTTARRLAFGSAFGTTRLRLTLPLFRSMPVPLPPLAEQARIVDQLERYTSVLDEEAVSLEHSAQKAVRLRQAILKRAFAGELAAQEPSNEAVGVQLERVSVQGEWETPRRMSLPAARGGPGTHG